MHIYTAKPTIQSLGYSCIPRCTWVSCWDSKQENTSIKDNPNNPDQQWGNETMKHNYYCTVDSLGHAKPSTWCLKWLLHIMSVCSISYTACKAHAACHTAICGLSRSHFSMLSHKTARFSEKCNWTFHIHISLIHPVTLRHWIWNLSYITFQDCTTIRHHNIK
jgi:hypothetical protein